ncbi:bifunctional peptidase and (3S)-lysyl hydroxylase Jmjd7-like isoform X2 [Apostichopus japonicus]|uniref:bifunctional peptidase and (3S)-lysyl hydroxylase Jmjd7-like isoform X2 n=1 Tax=Stichopus japonicus TaxID=307972 RepID=UPI003AB8C455
MAEQQERKSDLISCFEYLATEARDLYLSEKVPVIDKAPSALTFHRRWVTSNRPVIIKNAVTKWPALEIWNLNYLRETLKQKMVSVAVTPNGLADAVVENQFVLPEEKQMKFCDFVACLENQEENRGIYYIQKQNSNLTLEFPELLEDVAGEIPWASEAFVHKDHFENLYVVITGVKHFILHPPTDQPFIPYEMYPVASYKETYPGEFKVEPNETGDKVKWIPVDPLKPDLGKWPLYGKARPIHCSLHPGEMLYLPSMWYHHVRQGEGTIAVNYWYDMEFDIKFNYFQFVEKLLSTVNDDR